MIPSPLVWLFPHFGVVPGGNAPEPSSVEKVTLVEVAIWSRRLGRSRQDRDALGCRNPVATARAVATGSRQGRASRPGRDGPPRRDPSRCYRYLGPPSSGAFEGGIGATSVLELAVD
ncbi:hypothetical protein Taro_015652 [Colocasia esculenta]|uniref:Uncharacterized protein n=1 Tax=Colocasia esculenta TaxID=4460 RepID=A0A843UID7_COLES|nr:hypothetical protein [Colocasia esculenta]